MAMSCGLAITAVTAAAIPARRSLTRARSPPRAALRASQGSRAATTTIPVMIDDSRSVSSTVPSTTPRMTACRQPGRRPSRTAASSARGRKIAPSASWISNQAFHVIIVDRP